MPYFMNQSSTKLGGGHYTCSKCGVTHFGSTIHYCELSKLTVMGKNNNIVSNLLIPRYEVIGNYPNSEFTVGSILVLDNVGHDGKPCYNSYEDEGVSKWSEDDFNEYPHLFRKLKWCEKLDIKDMPKYVKVEGVVSGIYEANWTTSFEGQQPYVVLYDNSKDIGTRYFAEECIPTDKSEFDLFQRKDYETDTDKKSN